MEETQPALQSIGTPLLSHVKDCWPAFSQA